MNPGAKAIILLGVALIIIGVLWQLFLSLGWGPGLGLGKLPGDFAIEKPGFRFYLPLTSSLLISGLISFILWLLRR